MGRLTCSNPDPNCGCIETCALYENSWRSSGWNHDPKYLYELRNKLWDIDGEISIDIEAIDALLTIFENEKIKHNR
jgi:hypothetical protein